MSRRISSHHDPSAARDTSIRPTPPFVHPERIRRICSAAMRRRYRRLGAPMKVAAASFVVLCRAIDTAPEGDRERSAPVVHLSRLTERARPDDSLERSFNSRRYHERRANGREMTSPARFAVPEKKPAGRWEPLARPPLPWSFFRHHPPAGPDGSARPFIGTCQRVRGGKRGGRARLPACPLAVGRHRRTDAGRRRWGGSDLCGVRWGCDVSRGAFVFPCESLVLPDAVKEKQAECQTRSRRHEIAASRVRSLGASPERLIRGRFGNGAK